VVGFIHQINIFCRDLILWIVFIQFFCEFPWLSS